MQVFSLTLTQMLMMFLFIIIGFALNKSKILPENADTTMSKLQINVFSSAQLLYAMMSKCTVQTFKENSNLLFYGFVLSLAAIAIAYPLCKAISGNTKGDDERTYKKNILVYALTFGNYAFFGNFLIMQMWGMDMLFKYSMFTMPFNLFGNTWGLYIITPKSHGNLKLKDILSGLINTPLIALILGTLMGLSGLSVYVPDFVNTALENASNCMGPVAMLIAGFVIGKFNVRELLSHKKPYIVSLLRLVIIPALILLVFSALGVSVEILTFILIAFASPIVLIIIIYPAIFGADNHDSAAMVLVSTLLSVITIPLMFLLFIG